MFKGIIPFLKGSYSKILIGIIVALSLAVGYQCFRILNKDSRIQELIFDISYLESENQSLAMTISTLNHLRDLENAELDRVRAEADRLKLQADKYLKEVEDAYKDRDDRPLPDDIIKLLSDACEDISGNPCPHP